MSQPKLIKGRKYMITGAAKGHKQDLKDSRIKYPQTVVFDGDVFDVKNGGGAYEGWFPYRFTYRAQKLPTVELHKNRKGHYFTVKAANGKKLNHSFNSKRGCLNGIEALRRAMADFEIVDLTKPGK